MDDTSDGGTSHEAKDSGQYQGATEESNTVVEPAAPRSLAATQGILLRHPPRLPVMVLIIISEIIYPFVYIWVRCEFCGRSDWIVEAVLGKVSGLSYVSRRGI